MGEHVKQWLNAYYDGELRGRKLALVEEHLSDCLECQAALHQLEQLSAMLQMVPPAQVSVNAEKFASQVGMRLPRQVAQPEQPLFRASWLWHFVPVGVLAAIGFLQAVSQVAGLLTWIDRIGINPQVFSWLLPGQQSSPNTLQQISSLALGWGMPFNASITVSLILPALLAGCYLLWLVLWWMRYESSEQIEQLNGAGS